MNPQITGFSFPLGVVSFMSLGENRGQTTFIYVLGDLGA